jgi:hypothetical protein
MRLRLWAKIAMATVLACAALSGGARALAAGETFTIASPALLQADGAGLILTVQYSCPMMDSNASVSVTVYTERQQSNRKRQFRYISDV